MDLTHLTICSFVLFQNLQYYGFIPSLISRNPYSIYLRKYPLLTYSYLTFNIEIQAKSVAMIIKIN